MNLNNFEEQVDPTILQRGIDYYLEGLVEHKEELSENNYRLTVVGSQTYTVHVTLSQNKSILESHCNCPYDGGPICKHQVAALYAIKNMSEDVTDDNSIETILSKLEKEELVSLLLDLAIEHPVILHELDMRYRKQNAKDIKLLITSTIKDYKGYRNFIHYNDMYDFIEALSQALRLIDNVEDAIETFHLQFFLLKKVVGSLTYSDDSGGYTSLLIDDTIEAIENKARDYRHINSKTKHKIVDALLKTVNSKELDDWDDVKVNAMRAFLTWLDEDKLKSSILAYIDTKIKESSSYAAEQYVTLKYEIIKKFESKNTLRLFLIKNLDYTSIKENYMDLLVEEGKYEEIIEQALQAEQEEEYPGRVKTWKLYRYEANKKLGRVEEQKQLAFDLLIEGDFSYYTDLKNLTDDHDTLYQEVKNALEYAEENWATQQAYIELIQSEEDAEAMLEYATSRPSYILTFFDSLYPKYPKETKERYTELLRIKASHASNRKEYKELCKLIKDYGKNIGQEEKTALINEFLIEYKRRPAFVDELGKVK